MKPLLSACFAAAMLVFCMPAHAIDGWPYRHWTPDPGLGPEAAKPRRAERRRYRAYRPHRGTRVRAYVRHESVDTHLCVGELRGVGTQYVTETGAKQAAEKDWAETVRYDHGEKYMSIGRAQFYRSSCSRSSVGEVAGQVFFRCEVRATPCKAPLAP